MIEMTCYENLLGIVFGFMKKNGKPTSIVQTHTHTQIKTHKCLTPSWMDSTPSRSLCTLHSKTIFMAIGAIYKSTF